MILPPPADLEAFGRGEPVKVRVRMEPQPFDRGPIPGFSLHDWCWNTPPHESNPKGPSLASWIRTEEFATALMDHSPLGPPGTRHGVGDRWRYADMPGPTMTVVRTWATVVTPEPPERDADGWWWVAMVRKETA